MKNIFKEFQNKGFRFGFFTGLVLTNVLIGGMVLIWNILGHFPDIKTSDKVSAAFSFALLIFAALTCLLYMQLAILAHTQNRIATRNLWLTGALESHSTAELIMRAHERGIPVMWWDPNREKWDPNKQSWHSGREHRKIAQLPVVILYVPEGERDPAGSKITAPDAKPFTKEEQDIIDAERKRLEEINAKVSGGAK